MKKYRSIYLYGATLMISGIFLLFSGSSSFNAIKLTLGIILLLGAILAFISAFSRLRKQVQFVYHEMHAMTIAVYAVTVLLFCDTIEKLTFFTSFLFIFYTFSEIIFSNWLFNLLERIVYKILIVRVVLALVVGIGTIFAMNFERYTLEIYGALFVIVGINIILYVPVMKRRYRNDELRASNKPEPDEGEKS